jgi:hypothetical protein
MLRQSENGDGSDLCEGSGKMSRKGDGSDLCEGTLAFGEGRSALRAAGKSLPSLFSDPVRPPGGR